MQTAKRRQGKMARKKYEYLIKDVPAEFRKPGPPAKTKYGDRITDMPVVVEAPGNLPMVSAAMGKNHGVKTGWFLVPVVKPTLMVDEPHCHDFDQFICGALGRAPCIHARLRRLATKPYEKCGLERQIFEGSSKAAASCQRGSSAF
jgi:hypothetical protein